MRSLSNAHTSPIAAQSTIMISSFSHQTSKSPSQMPVYPSALQSYGSLVVESALVSGSIVVLGAPLESASVVAALGSEVDGFVVDDGDVVPGSIEPLESSGSQADDSL